VIRRLARTDPDQACSRRVGLLRPAWHQQRTHRSDQRPPRTPPRPALGFRNLPTTSPDPYSNPAHSDPDYTPDCEEPVKATARFQAAVVGGAVVAPDLYPIADRHGAAIALPRRVFPGRRPRVRAGSSVRRGASHWDRRRPLGGGSRPCAYTETMHSRDRQEKETKGKEIGGLLRFAPARLEAHQGRARPRGGGSRGRVRVAMRDAGDEVDAEARAMGGSRLLVDRDGNRQREVTRCVSRGRLKWEERGRLVWPVALRMMAGVGAELRGGGYGRASHGQGSASAWRRLRRPCPRACGTAPAGGAAGRSLPQRTPRGPYSRGVSSAPVPPTTSSEGESLRIRYVRNRR
jgi:hypothetical protein